MGIRFQITAVSAAIFTLAILVVINPFGHHLVDTRTTSSIIGPDD